MENQAPVAAPYTPIKSVTTPKDFFLWLGTIVALYGAIAAFLTLLFQYINIAYPDMLAYSESAYNGPIQASMAALLVLTPIALGCILAIRRSIVHEPGKADVWVRKWAIVLTIFITIAAASIDLITIFTTFFGGEITTRFVLKALLVLMVAIVVALHFMADLWGYWTLHRRKADLIGAVVGALAVMTIIAGFFIIGSPAHVRALRIDEQKVSDLQNIQYQVTDYWQQKRELPTSLEALNDPLQSYTVPSQPGKDGPYEYVKNNATSFSLCATFAASSDVLQAQTNTNANDPDQNFMHSAGHTCFTRTIDPSRYPFTPKAQ